MQANIGFRRIGLKSDSIINRYIIAMEDFSMISTKTLIELELKKIKKIVADETWLEGERRHCPVSPDDAEVQKHVNQVVLQYADQITNEAIEELNNQNC